MFLLSFIYSFGMCIFLYVYLCMEIAYYWLCNHCFIHIFVGNYCFVIDGSNSIFLHDIIHMCVLWAKVQSFFFISSNCFLGTFHNFIFRLKRHDQSNWHSKQNSKQIFIFIFFCCKFSRSKFLYTRFSLNKFVLHGFHFCYNTFTNNLSFFSLNHYIFFTNNNSQYYLLPIIIQINRVFFFTNDTNKTPIYKNKYKIS